MLKTEHRGFFNYSEISMIQNINFHVVKPELNVLKLYLEICSGSEIFLMKNDFFLGMEFCFKNI